MKKKTEVKMISVFVIAFPKFNSKEESQMQIYNKSHSFFYFKGKSCFKCHKKNIFAEHRKMNKNVKFIRY